MQVDILEAKNRLSELIRSAQAGEEVVIAIRGEPVARLVPAHGAPKPVGALGSGPDILGWIRNHPVPDYARRSAEEIDAAIREERGSWE
jgi:prevent-host-death family protein